MANAPAYTDLGVPDEGEFVLNWGAAPFSQTAPSIAGAAVVGETLIARPADWHGTEPIDVADEWLRCDSSGDNCSPVGGAASSTHMVTASDVGSTFRVDEAASNIVGVASAESGPSPVVTEPAGPPVNQTPPTISGTAAVGQTLSVTDPGGWAGARPIEFSYQWQNCVYSGGSTQCENIAAAIGTSYVVQRADASDSIRVVVTATNVDGSAGASSDTSGPVPTPPPSPPTNTGMPALHGTPTVDGTLAVDEGIWYFTGDSASVVYQWESCDAAGAGCVAIDGATSTSYKASDADLGHTLRAQVTVTDSIGSTTVTTDPSPAIGPKPGPVTPPPFTAIDIAPNAASAQVRDVNNRGEAVGTFVDDNGVDHPFSYDAGGLHDLSAIAPDFRPIAVNDKGVIIGTSEISGSGAEILDATGLHVIGGWTPTDVNNLGHASGVDASGRPVYWDGSALHVIDTRGLPHGFGAQARASSLSDSNEVVRWQFAGDFGRGDAFVYEGNDGSIRVLSTGAGFNGRTNEINEAGDVAGSIDNSLVCGGVCIETTPAIWVHGFPEVLAGGGGGATGINASDEVIGTGDNGPPSGAGEAASVSRSGSRRTGRRRRSTTWARSPPTCRSIRAIGRLRRMRISSSFRRRWPSSRCRMPTAPARATRTDIPSPRPTPQPRRSRSSS